MQKKNRLLLYPLLLLALLTLLSCQHTQRKVSNIESFAKLYGYVRFFHPSDEAQTFDWDKFALYGVKQVSTATNPRELTEKLNHLFAPIAPSLIIYPTTAKLAYNLERITPPEAEKMKQISWQHYGVALNHKNLAYSSVRLNRNKRVFLGAGVAQFNRTVDVKAVEGQSIRLRAAVKLVEGKAELWLRTLKAEGQPGRIIPMKGKPITSGDWTVYEVTGKLEEEDRKVILGGRVIGVAEAYFDDIQLVVKENHSWKQLKLKNPGFEEGKKDKLPRSWKVDGLGYEFKVTAEYSPSGDYCLGIKSKPVDHSVRLFEAELDFGQLINEDIGNGLSCFVPMVLLASADNTYPQTASNRLEILKAAMDTEFPGDVYQLSASSPEVRSAAAVVAWNVFQHFYANFPSEVNWKKQLETVLYKAYSDKDENQFLSSLRHMIAVLQDGQANVVLQRLEDTMTSMPLTFDWLNDKLVVSESWDEVLRPGDEILAVDGVESPELLHELEKGISGSSHWKRYRALQSLGRGVSGSEAQLEIHAAVEPLNLRVKRSISHRLHRYRWEPFQRVRDDLYYVDLARVSVEEFEEKLGVLYEASGIIFDCRGFMDYKKKRIFSYLIDKSISSPVWNTPQILYPDRREVEFENLQWRIDPREPKLNGKMVFIMDAGTYGTAEVFLSIVKYYKLGLLVGQPSAGTMGEINRFKVPGGFLFNFTGMRVLKHNLSEFPLSGIKPDYRVRKSMAAVKKGEDEFLKKAVSLFN